MENKLDVLTKKLYDEGVEKAKKEADQIIGRAKEEAAKVVADAEARAKAVEADAEKEIENRRKKADAEMALSARQAMTALKQSVTNLISGKVAGEMVQSALKDDDYVQNLLLEIVKRWDVASGTIDLELVLSDDEKVKFQKVVAAKYKKLLDGGLEIKAGGTEGAFVLRPKAGGYELAFSDELFEAFFNQYIRTFTKGLLYGE